MAVALFNAETQRVGNEDVRKVRDIKRTSISVSSSSTRYVSTLPPQLLPIDTLSREEPGLLRLCRRFRGLLAGRQVEGVTEKLFQHEARIHC